MDQVSFSAEQFSAAQPAPNSPSFLAPDAGMMHLWVFGMLVTLKVTGNETGGGFGFVEALVPPGSSGPHPHYHTREDEYWHMTDGELTWIVGGREFHAVQGAFIHLPRGVMHGFQNRSGKFARMEAMYTPGAFMEWFLKVGISTGGLASVDSFPGPTPTHEDYKRGKEWMEVYGVGLTPSHKKSGSSIEHGEL